MVGRGSAGSQRGASAVVPKNIKGVVEEDGGSDSDDSDMDGIDVEYLIKSAERVKRSADDTAKFLRSRSSHHKRKVKK